MRRAAFPIIATQVVLAVSLVLTCLLWGGSTQTQAARQSELDLYIVPLECWLNLVDDGVSEPVVYITPEQCQEPEVIDRLPRPVGVRVQTSVFTELNPNAPAESNKSHEADDNLTEADSSPNFRDTSSQLEDKTIIWPWLVAGLVLLAVGLLIVNRHLFRKKQ